MKDAGLSTLMRILISITLNHAKNVAEEIDRYYYERAMKNIKKKGKVYITRIYFHFKFKFIPFIEIERENIKPIIDYIKISGITTFEEYRKGTIK